MSRFPSLLLAAGRGTRLEPLSARIPKPAIPLLDVPLGGPALADLHALGGRVFANLSPAHDLVRRALSPFGPRTEFLLELPDPVGSAGTLFSLRERLNAPVVTRNADSLTDATAAEAIDAHLAAGARATIVTVAVEDNADLIVQEGRAVRFVDRRTESGPGDMWIGISVFERDTLDLIGPQRPLDLATGLLAGLVETGDVAVHRHDGYSMDVGTIGRYVTATQDLLYGRTGIELTPPGEIVEVGGGRAYIGPGAEVDPAALGAGAVVLAGAMVGAGAFIERAIVWPGEQVPSGTRVRDKVWAFGALQA